MKKYNFLSSLSMKILICSFLFITFYVQGNEYKLIATNHDNSINLDEEKLNKWLGYRTELKFSEKAIQIEAYFLEKAILQKKNELSSKILDEVLFKNKIKRNNSSIKINKKAINSAVTLDQNELDKVIDADRKQNASTLNKKRIFQIYLKYPSDVNDKVKDNYFKQMLEYKNQINTLEDFKTIASKHSDSQTRINSGLIGNISEGILPKKLSEIVLSLGENELSDIIKSTNGLNLFYCSKHITPKKYTDNEIIKAATNKLKNYHQQIKWNEFVQSGIDSLDIQIYYEKLNGKDENGVIARSKQKILTKQQLLWLLNKEDALDGLTNPQIKSAIEGYFLDDRLFNTLSDAQKQNIINEHQIEYDRSILKAYLTQKINEKLKAPSIEMVRDFHDKNQSLFKRHKHYSFEFIAINLTKNKKESFDKIEKIRLDSLKSDNSFSQLAKKYSRFENRFPSGIVNSISVIGLPKVFGINLAKQIKLLSVGEISKPFESDSGLLWILKLNAIEKARNKTFDEAEQKATNMLGNKILNEIKIEIEDKILKDQKIQIL